MLRFYSIISYFLLVLLSPFVFSLSRYLALTFFQVCVPPPACHVKSLRIAYEAGDARFLPSLTEEPLKMLLFQNIHSVQLAGLHLQDSESYARVASFMELLVGLRDVSFDVFFTRFLPYWSKLQHVNSIYLTQLLEPPLDVTEHARYYRALRQVHIEDAKADCSPFLALPQLENFIVKFARGSEA
jgi:hypothetical protein